MTKENAVGGLAALLVLLGASSIAQAQQPVNFLPAGSGDWGVPTNWEDYGEGQNIPEGQFDEFAVINSGGVAIVNSVFSGSTSPQGPGAINVTNGTLEIQNAGDLTLAAPASGPLVDRSVTIGDTLNIQGAGELNAASITFQAGGTFDVDFTVGTSSPVNVEGAASLNGALMLDYTAIANPSGSRTLITAGSATGSFSSVATTGLGVNQTARISNSSGLVQATIQNLLSLTVDRDTGAVTINNVHGAPVPLDGYSIQSASGSLNPAGLSGLGGGGWSTSASNSANAVAQLFEGTLGSPSTTIAGGASPTISSTSGLFSAAAPTAFLQDVEDLVFEYTDATGTTFGPVNYVGSPTTPNNIVLTINSAGEAAMLNMSPFAQEVEAYRITSSVNPLQTGTWDTFQSQSIDDGTWQSSSQSGTGMLLEAQEDGTTTFGGGNVYNIGQILSPGFSQSGIEFEFLLAGDLGLTTGVVQFGDLPSAGLQGDFNGDGKVDAADYTVWRDNFGESEGGLLNGNGDGGTVGTSDYDLWRASYGSTISSGAALVETAPVPEPGAFTLVAMALIGLGSMRTSSQAQKRRCS